MKLSRKKRLVNFLWMFLYIFNIDFVFIPGLLRTRPIIGAWGAIVEAFRRRKQWSRVYTNIILLFCLYFVATAITTIANHHFDFWFSQHAILECACLIAAIYIMRKFPAASTTFSDILYFIAIVITIQNIIAFVGYFVPPLSKFIISIQSYESSIETTMEAIAQRGDTVRIYGFGIAQRFHGGIISGLAIISYCYLIAERAIPTVKGGILIIITLVSGMFIARTTTIGLLVGLLLFVHWDYRTIARAIKLLLIVVVSIALLYGIYVQFFANSLSIDWAFELVINLLDRKGLETASTNDLQTMWHWPDNVKTWLIGDGYFTDRFGHYYKRTDVGYLRTIYNLGLMGMAIRIGIQVYLIKAMYVLSGKSRSVLKLGIVLFIYFCALNVKGMADVNFFYYLLIAHLYNRELYFRRGAKKLAVP